jgi:bis(5'-nucleosidyl)-tetraphosphatase
MIQSSGVAIVDLNLEEPLLEASVLCVRAYANWDFPKGQQEEGEAIITTAIREVEEETSLQHGSDYILSGAQAGATTYGTGAKKKTATYYIGMRMSDKTPFLPVNPELGKPENDEYRWVALSNLHSLMPGRLQGICDSIVSWVGEKVDGSDE